MPQKWSLLVPCQWLLGDIHYYHPPWRQPRGKTIVSLVNSHTNSTSKRCHLWEIGLRFALNSTTMV